MIAELNNLSEVDRAALVLFFLVKMKTTDAAGAFCRDTDKLRKLISELEKTIADNDFQELYNISATYGNNDAAGYYWSLLNHDYFKKHMATVCLMQNTREKGPSQELRGDSILQEIDSMSGGIAYVADILANLPSDTVDYLIERDRLRDSSEPIIRKDMRSQYYHNAILELYPTGHKEKLRIVLEKLDIPDIEQLRVVLREEGVPPEQEVGYLSGNSKYPAVFGSEVTANNLKNIWFTKSSHAWTIAPIMTITAINHMSDDKLKELTPVLTKTDWNFDNYALAFAFNKKFQETQDPYYRNAAKIFVTAQQDIKRINTKNQIHNLSDLAPLNRLVKYQLERYKSLAMGDS